MTQSSSIQGQLSRPERLSIDQVRAILNDPTMRTPLRFFAELLERAGGCLDTLPQDIPSRIFHVVLETWGNIIPAFAPELAILRSYYTDATNYAAFITGQGQIFYSKSLNAILHHYAHDSGLNLFIQAYEEFLFEHLPDSPELEQIRNQFRQLARALYIAPIFPIVFHETAHFLLSHGTRIKILRDQYLAINNDPDHHDPLLEKIWNVFCNILADAEANALVDHFTQYLAVHIFMHHWGAMHPNSRAYILRRASRLAQELNLKLSAINHLTPRPSDPKNLNLSDPLSALYFNLLIDPRSAALPINIFGSFSKYHISHQKIADSFKDYCANPSDVDIIAKGASLENMVRLLWPNVLAIYQELKSIYASQQKDLEAFLQFINAAQQSQQQQQVKDSLLDALHATQKQLESSIISIHEHFSAILNLFRFIDAPLIHQTLREVRAFSHATITSAPVYELVSFAARIAHALRAIQQSLPDILANPESFAPALAHGAILHDDAVIQRYALVTSENIHTTIKDILTCLETQKYQDIEPLAARLFTLIVAHPYFYSQHALVQLVSSIAEQLKSAATSQTSPSEDIIQSVHLLYNSIHDYIDRVRRYRFLPNESPQILSDLLRALDQRARLTPEQNDCFVRAQQQALYACSALDKALASSPPTAFLRTLIAFFALNLIRYTAISDILFKHLVITDHSLIPLTHTWETFANELAQAPSTALSACFNQKHISPAINYIVSLHNQLANWRAQIESPSLKAALAPLMRACEQFQSALLAAEGALHLEDIQSILDYVQHHASKVAKNPNLPPWIENFLRPPSPSSSQHLDIHNDDHHAANSPQYA